MKLSREISENTLNALNNAPFDELDAAESRLSGYDLHLAYLLDRMTPEERHVVNYVKACSAASETLEWRPYSECEVTTC